MFDPQTEYDVNYESFPIRDFHDYKEEFVVRPPVPAKELTSRAAKEGFLLGTVEWQGEEFLQLAVTEKRTRADMDRLVAFLAVAS